MPVSRLLLISLFAAAAHAGGEESATVGAATYFGLAGDLSPREIAFDAAANLVMTGYGQFDLDEFPGATTIGPITQNVDGNILVVKMTPDGVTLWATIIGGSDRDRGYGIALDADDNIYIGGSTSSVDFPVTPGAFDTTHNGGQPDPVHGALDAFALKLSPDGQTILWATFLGGPQDDTGRGGIAIDAAGAAYVVGSTKSVDFLGPIPQHVNRYIGGTSDAFITKVAPDGSDVVWNRFIGAAGPDIEEVIVGARIADDGTAYAAAIVRSPGAFTTDGSTYHGGAADLYVTKISPDGQDLLYASLWGGSGAEFMEHRLGLDADGQMYVCGATTSNDIVMTNADQPAYGGGGSDAFLVRFDDAGQAVWSTYIGGAGDESVFGPEVHADGTVMVGGYSTSTDLPPTPDASDPTPNGGSDGLVRQYDAATGTLLFSTFFGGTGDETGRYGAIDAAGRLYLCGHTTSDDLPTTPGVGQPDYVGGEPGFMARFELPGGGPAADLDGDGDVDAADLAALLGAWGPATPCPPAPAADLDGDGQVGSADLAILLSQWG